MDQKFPFLVADPKSTVESADAIVELPCMSPHFFDVGLSSNVFAKAFANSILLVVICQVAFFGGYIPYNSLCLYSKHIAQISFTHRVSL